MFWGLPPIKPQLLVAQDNPFPLFPVSILSFTRFVLTQRCWTNCFVLAQMKKTDERGRAEQQSQDANQPRPKERGHAVQREIRWLRKWRATGEWENEEGTREQKIGHSWQNWMNTCHWQALLLKMTALSISLQPLSSLIGLSYLFLQLIEHVHRLPHISTQPLISVLKSDR